MLADNAPPIATVRLRDAALATSGVRRRGCGDIVPTVSSATRPAGRYVVVWDGLDDQGQAMPAGDYLLNLESSRQQGYYVLLREPITLGTEPFTAAFPGSRDLGEVEVAYRRRA